MKIYHITQAMQFLISQRWLVQGDGSSYNNGEILLDERWKPPNIDFPVKEKVTRKCARDKRLVVQVHLNYYLNSIELTALMVVLSPFNSQYQHVYFPFSFHFIVCVICRGNLFQFPLNLCLVIISCTLMLNQRYGKKNLDCGHKHLKW